MKDIKTNQFIIQIKRIHVAKNLTMLQNWNLPFTIVRMAIILKKER